MIDEDKDIQVIKVDIELFESLAETLGVFSVPTLIYFKEGKEVKRVSGMQSVESLLKFIR